MAGDGHADALGAASATPAVLVVNDRADQRAAIEAMLGQLDVMLVEADSGRAALRAVLHQRFALILMDVRMPTMGGYETAKLMRQWRPTSRTPIIFITAHPSDDVETLAAYATGAVDFIFTPVVPAVLRAKVSVFIDLFVQSEELHRSLASIMTLNGALRDSEASTQAVLDNVADGIVTASKDGVIRSVNRSARALFGYSDDEMIGRPLTFMIAPGHRDAFCDAAEVHRSLVMEGTPRARPTETLGRRQDRSTFPIEVEHSEMKLADGNLALALVRDISDRKAYTESLEHQALHDGLTGLANRTLFGAHLLHALASAKRTNDTRAVLVMDLDGFKQVNDRLGHDQGDNLLRQVSHRLVAELRDTDTIARLGGDEFAILPGGATDLAAAATIAWKIQQTCAAAFTLNDEHVHAPASIGIALYPAHGTTTDELLRRADAAMYVAKRSGSGHAVSDIAREKQAARQLALLDDLRHCIARDELVLHFQPKINLGTRAITGVEALVRWRHPVDGLLAPGSFMPEVERTELIIPVTRWVLDQALRQQQIWRDGGFDLTMAVNISAHSLRPHSTLPDTVAELTETWGTTPDTLTLELTEGALIEAAAPDVLGRLHDMGERMSIDDFGTGYSSLAYLQRLPVDELKIDRSFVTSLAPGTDDAVIVRSTVDLAHNLGLTVVAEGVEDDVAMGLLHACGCDSAQGYFFGRPCPAAELTGWLTESPYGSAVGAGG